MKVVVFPYDINSEPLVKYEELLNDIQIYALVSPMGFGIKSKVVSSQNKNYIVQCAVNASDISNIDALLIVDSYNNIEFDLIKEQIEKIARFGKNIILAKKVELNEYSEIVSICEKYNVQLIRFEEKPGFQMNKDVTGLQDIHTPIIVIMGNGIRCNKFELQVEIRKQFIEKNYKVSSVSSRSNSMFDGIHSFPEFMSENGLSESQKIICYNQYIKYLEKIEKPEVIIIGIPGGLMPITRQKPGDFGISAYEILNAVGADFIILSLYKDEYKEEYFDEMNNLLRYRFGTSADCFNISNNSIDRFSINSYMPIKYLEHEDLSVETQCKGYKHNVFCRNTYTQMGIFMLDTLEGYDEIKIL